LRHGSARRLFEGLLACMAGRLSNACANHNK
jgi:hypothetical protein